MGNSRLELIFQSEAASKLKIAEQKLLELESTQSVLGDLEEIFRCIHSIKGAASVVQNSKIVDASHHLEEEVDGIRRGKTRPSSESISNLLQQLDALKALCFPKQLVDTSHNQSSDEQPPLPLESSNSPQIDTSTCPLRRPVTALSLDTELINELMGLSGDNLISWRAASRASCSISKGIRNITNSLRTLCTSATTSSAFSDQINAASIQLLHSLNELDEHFIRSASQAQRLYHKALECRLRPFGDSQNGWQRLVRDTSVRLHKNVKLTITGASTHIDRELLQLLESPITHLIRNAIDHGIESPEARTKIGKSPDGTITIHAAMINGRFRVTLSDDGQGLEREKIRSRAVSRNLCTPEVLGRMTDEEISQFIFLPGFSTKDDVTEVSGRGVGLDVVHTELQRIGGTIKVEWTEGVGTTFVIELANQQSIMRGLLFRICGELYAVPLVAVEEIVRCSASCIVQSQGKHFVHVRDALVPISHAAQVLECKNLSPSSELLSIIILKTGDATLGIVVDVVERQEDVSLQAIDSRLGTIPDVRCAAFTETGELAVVLDERQLALSIASFLNSRQSSVLAEKVNQESVGSEKTVLIVDDSLTVRELERKILMGRGYKVDVAHNGVEGLKMARASRYDLVVTDVDMPEMNGIELVSHLKQDPALTRVPVIIVSYKDREEDRKRGLSVGADAYLTKSSFHDETFVETVIDLAGEPYE